MIPADVIDGREITIPDWINPYPNEETPDPESPRLPGRPRGATQIQLLWDRAIIALLTIPDVGDAAKTIGVSRAQLYAWMKDPVFMGQLNEIRRHGMFQAILSIYGSMAKTMQVLMEIRDDPKMNGATRVAAARELIALWREEVNRERGEEEAKEKIRQLTQMVAELTGVTNGGESVGPPALTNGNEPGVDAAEGEREAGTGAGEAGAGIVGPGESATDDPV